MGRGHVCHFFCGFPLKEAAVLGQVEGTATMIESLLFFWPQNNPRGQNPEQPGLWEEEKWLKERKKGKAKFCARFLHQCLMDSYHIALYRLKEV